MKKEDKQKEINVLIADDDTLISNALKDNCESMGMNVDIVHESDSLINHIKDAIFKGTKPDIIFLDILLPTKTGVDLLIDIKEIDRSLLERTIIMTSLNGSNYVAKAIENGAMYYVSKNTSDTTQLINTAQKILESNK